MTPETFWDLFAGYSAFWLLIAIFLYRLMQEQVSLRAELEQLKHSSNSSHQDSSEKQAQTK